jgi:hypothetical protein
VHNGGITIANDGQIGSVGDADAIAISSTGIVTFSQAVSATISTATQDSITTMSNLTTTGALNAGSITSGFGAINNGNSGITSTGNIASSTITASTSIDITGSGGIILENDETITNSTDGVVLINGTVAAGPGGAAGVFQSNGNNDLTLKTGNSTTGSINITDGANGEIAITPNGSGIASLNSATIRLGTGGADTTITGNSTHDLTITTNNGTNSGAIVIEQGADQPVTVGAHGSGSLKLGASGNKLGFFGSAGATKVSVNNASTIGSTVAQGGVDTSGATADVPTKTEYDALRTDVTNLRTTVANLLAALKQYNIVS